MEFIATAVKTVKKGEQRNAVLKQLIGAARLPERFDLPVVAPELSFIGVNAQAARALDSKKVPLWLAFETTNPFADEYMAIFKVGDDLRQDMVTLQMIRAMDKLWKENRLDLHMITCTLILVLSGFHALLACMCCVFGSVESTSAAVSAQRPLGWRVLSKIATQ